MNGHQSQSPTGLILCLAVLILIFGGFLLAPQSSAQQSCPDGDPPCITAVTESGTNKRVLTVHWSGNKKFDEYHVRVVPATAGTPPEFRGMP
jgi:hypothetical protein